MRDLDAITFLIAMWLTHNQSSKGVLNGNVDHAVTLFGNVIAGHDLLFALSGPTGIDAVGGYGAGKKRVTNPARPLLGKKDVRGGAAHAIRLADNGDANQAVVFYDVRDRLDDEPQFKPTVAAMAPPAAAASAKLNQYLVFFDFNRSNLDEGAAKLLQQAANSAKQSGVRAIKLTGHTDVAGGNDYNQALSERRAEVVRAELVKNGVPTNKITSSGVGEAGQLVPTADGIREPQNRRTEITLQ